MMIAYNWGLYITKKLPKVSPAAFLLIGYN
jgi:hypothetical protein